MSFPQLSIHLEFTPNPNTLKFSVNRVLLPSEIKGGRQYEAGAEAKQESQLATELLEIPGVSAVFIGKDFVTVTKAETGDWDQVHQAVSEALKSFLIQSEQNPETHSIFNSTWLSEYRQSHAHTAEAQMSEGQDTKVTHQIREILDREIRPAVAMDGGDITFDHFENGIVYLELKGACSGCPSSTATLKDGIEARLKSQIPEVKEVVSV